jgi:hypothetical protein
MLRKFGMTKDCTDDLQQLARSGIAQEFSWWGRGGNQMLREMWKLCDCDSVHVECVGNIYIGDSTTVLRLDNEDYTCPNKNADSTTTTRSFTLSLTHSLTRPCQYSPPTSNYNLTRLKRLPNSLKQPPIWQLEVEAENSPSPSVEAASTSRATFSPSTLREKSWACGACVLPLILPLSLYTKQIRC